MSALKNLFGKGPEGPEPGPEGEAPKESKLVSSYNQAYDQARKQETPAAESARPEVTSEAPASTQAVPETPASKPKAQNRLARLTARFRKVEVPGVITRLPKPKDLGSLVGWFKTHKVAGLLGILVIGVVVAWVVSSLIFGAKKPAQETTGVEVMDVGTQVKVVKVAKTDFADSILAMGNIKGFAQINLGFQISGVVSGFNFREGDEIKAGQIIVQVDPQEQMLKYEEAKVNYNNMKNLYDMGAIIPLKLQEAKIKLELAQTELAKTALVAPSDGILGSRDVEVGSTINPNMKAGVFLDINDVFAEVGIMEREINKVVVGQDVKINVDAYPDLDFGGTVTNISPMVKGKSKTLNVKVQIANPYRLLLPGMFVRVRIKIFETKNAIIIPRPAVKKLKGAYQVFTVNQNNKAEMRTVKLGYITTDNMQITEGLNEGDLVVVEGMDELKDGAKVQVMEYQSTSY